MEHEGITEMLEGVSARLRRLLQERERLVGMLNDLATADEDQFAARWLLREMGESLEDAEAAIRTLRSSP